MVHPIGILDPFNIYDHYRDSLKALEDKYQIEIVLGSNLYQIEEAIINKGCLLILLLSKSNEPILEDIIRKCKENPLIQWIPLVVLANVTLGMPLKAAYYNLGADDCVSLESDSPELSFRVKSLVQKAEAFVNQAFRDPLTGTYNRRYLFLRITRIWEEFNTQNNPVCIAFIDLDHFKSKNDTYGHDVGDLVLQGVASLISSNLAHTDLLARFGGEEYVVLMDGAIDSAANRIENILDLCNNKPVAIHNEIEHYVTFSAGVNELRPGMGVEEFVKLADEAAYKAKRRGRNQVVLSKPKKDTHHVLILNSDDRYHDEILAMSPNIEVSSLSINDDINTFLEKKFVDTILIDIGETSKNGYRIVKDIKNKEFDTKILLLSGRGLRQQFLNMCESLQVDAYLCRPFSAHEITDKLKILLEIPN